MPKTSREQIDKDEKKILALLQKNSNESIDRIAKHVVSQGRKFGELLKVWKKTVSSGDILPLLTTKRMIRNTI